MAKALFSASALALLTFRLISASPHPAVTPAPALDLDRRAAFGCEHAADPDGAQGFCPAVGDAGWCVCSDSSTYAITTGSDPCPYTTPPPSGPTTLASENCGGTTTVAQTETVIPVPAATNTNPPTVEGAPNDQVSCPVRKLTMKATSYGIACGC